MCSGPDKTSELPIACTLGASDFEARLAEIRALGRRSLLGVEGSTGGAVVLSFRCDPETEADLRRIVAAEAECCAFLTLKITAGKALKLMIDGPDDARPVIEELVDSFVAEVAP